MIQLPPFSGRILLGIGALALLWAAWAWSDHRGYARGAADTDARWTAANTRILSATIRAQNAADTIARQREAENAATIEDLKHEAAKGTDDAVGPGVAGVLDRLRASQGR